MERVAELLSRAGFTLPQTPLPAGSYVPAVSSRGFVFTAGQLPMVGGSLPETGLVGRDVTEENATHLASVAALNALAAASTVCDLDDVVRVVKLTVYVACEPAFASQPAVANGASRVLEAAFGSAGSHAREAVGVASLPLGAPVEVSLVLEVG